MKFSSGAINKSFVLCAVIAAALLAPTRANAAPFTCITGSSSDCALATSTLSWSWNGLDFAITNSGSGYVSEVYFDLGTGMSASFQSGAGGTVNFYQGAAPGSLPGGNSVGFVSDISFDSDSQGNPHWGIDTGETATFRILGAVLGSFDSGALASGVHVRSLVTSSASLVTSTRPTSVPEPTTLGLLSFGVLGLAATRRRKQ